MKLKLEGILVMMLFIVMICLLALVWMLADIRHKDTALHVVPRAQTATTPSGFTVPPPPF